MAFKDFLKEQLQSRGWTQEELANRSGISPSTVNAFFTRNTQPGVDRLRLISDATGISMRRLLIAAGHAKESDFRTRGLTAEEGNSITLVSEDSSVSQAIDFRHAGIRSAVVRASKCTGRRRRERIVIILGSVTPDKSRVTVNGTLLDSAMISLFYFLYRAVNSSRNLWWTMFIQHINKGLQPPMLSTFDN